MLRWEFFIEQLAKESPQGWGLLYVAEDRARGEYSAQVKYRAARDEADDRDVCARLTRALQAGRVRYRAAPGGGVPPRVRD